jgi:hypothetical protein
MVQVIITKRLEEEINKRFKHESVEIFSLMQALKDSPSKGKEVGCVGNIVIKELKYKKFRFYFIADRYMIKFLKSEELQGLLIRFVRMSEKKDQQKVIDEIKSALRNLGDEGF